MAMLRSALTRASHRLSASEILKPSLSNAHLTRSFTSPAPAAPTRRIPNLQVQRHFPVFSKGTEGVKLAGQKRFFSTESIEPVIERIEKKWLDNTIEPWHLELYVAVVGLSSFVATTIAYHRLGRSVEALNDLKPGKSGGPDGDGH